MINAARALFQNIEYDSPLCPECGAYEWIEIRERYVGGWYAIKGAEPFLEVNSIYLRYLRNCECAQLNMCEACGLIVT